LLVWKPDITGDWEPVQKPLWRPSSVPDGFGPSLLTRDRTGLGFWFGKTHLLALPLAPASSPDTIPSSQSYGRREVQDCAASSSPSLRHEALSPGRCLLLACGETGLSLCNIGFALWADKRHLPLAGTRWTWLGPSGFERVAGFHSLGDCLLWERPDCQWRGSRLPFIDLTPTLLISLQNCLNTIRRWRHSTNHLDRAENIWMAGMGTHFSGFGGVSSSCFGGHLYSGFLDELTL
jgi:hypothetical protein